MDTPADMVLRGPSTCDDEECMKKRDITLMEDLDKVGQRLTGYTRAGNVYQDYAVQPPRQAEGSAPQPQSPEPLFGHGPDFGYFQFGAVWYGDEYWISGGRVKDYNGDGQYGDWEGSAGAPSAASRTASCPGRSSTTRRSARSRSVA